MRTIPYSHIVKTVRELCLKAAVELPDDLFASLEKSFLNESSPLGRSILKQCIENGKLASSQSLPICQDTGSAVYFLELGSEVMIEGGILPDAINEGTRLGYKDGYLRKSIVSDPLFKRKNTGTNTPALIHTEIVPGDKLSITLLPKGGGSENMSALSMLKPSDGKNGVIDFVVRTVTEAGGNPCPPVIVGVGIGGTSDKAMYLAKKALLRDIGSRNPDDNYDLLEKTIFDAINRSGVGPQGLGGNVTALAVHIEHFPCHIASMPVAINLNCHAARKISTTI